MPSFPQPGDTAAGQVVIAIDPHKASWTAVAVDARLQALEAIRVPVGPAGYRRLRRFAAAWPQATWAIEGAIGLGSPLTSRLAADGHHSGRRAGQTRPPGAAAVIRPRPQNR